MAPTPCRERRSWTAKEDQLLREAVEREDPHNPNPSKWHAIAKHVPNRTNKDCRKRWFAKMASDVVKGGWSPEEDERLVRGIKIFGTRWSQVASIVQTRNSDQCAKRWTDTLNPSIDRTMWTPEADEMLLKAVAEHGKVWTKIVKTYFPGRTGLSAKNRYNSITRFNSDHSRGRVRRKTPESPSQLAHRKSANSSPVSSIPSSASSSCSGTPSPITPSMSISTPVSTPPYQPGLFESFPGWSQSSIDGSYNNGLALQATASQNYEAAQHALLPKSQIIEPSFPSFDNSLNHTFSQYATPSLTFQNDTAFQHMFTNAQHHQPMYPLGPQDAAQLYSQAHISNDISNQFSMFGSLPSEVDSLMGLTWDHSGAQTDVKQTDRFTVPAAGESLYIF